MTTLTQQDFVVIEEMIESRFKAIRKQIDLLVPKVPRQAKASELIFLSQVKRDGSGVDEVSEDYKKGMLENPLMKDELFEIKVLSLSLNTYIASGFNTFIVKLRD